MKTLHAIQPQPTLLEFLKVCWPNAEPVETTDGMIEFWMEGYVQNTMPIDSWDDWYGRWLDNGAPQDRNLAMSFIR